MLGERFGRLVVLECIPGRKRSEFPNVRCRVRCDCGVEKIVLGGSLREGSTQSCGCLRVERITRHGDSDSPTYNCWKNMRARCLNPNHSSYADYGGRGITIAERWARYENFLADMGQRPSTRHSIDRIDNDGGYGPTNCRWATQREQNANQRRRLAPALALLFEIRGEIELPGELAARVDDLLGGYLGTIPDRRRR